MLPFATLIRTSFQDAKQRGLTAKKKYPWYALLLLTVFDVFTHYAGASFDYITRTAGNIENAKILVGRGLLFVALAPTCAHDAPVLSVLEEER